VYELCFSVHISTGNFLDDGYGICSTIDMMLMAHYCEILLQSTMEHHCESYFVAVEVLSVILNQSAIQHL
jgi:hypothetical protein